MKYDLSNEVIARLNSDSSTLPNRSLDLGNIITPELGLLSPNRNEIAPRGINRDIALVAYSERLRNSYKLNEGGLRDGMIQLGEAFRNGQAISITCFCRAGQMCHADVVKLAIEKVAKAIDTREQNRVSGAVIERDPSFQSSNPRTERAINEILAFSKSDIALSRLDDTEGRSPSEHASYLNRQSQFLRDLYERGGTVTNGVLVIPRETQSLSSQMHIATAEYGVKRLEPLIGVERSRELIPQILEYGKSIAGSNSDRESEAKIFRWMYDALEGKNELLEQSGESDRSESVQERFDRALADIVRVSDEMSKLESNDRFEQHESFDDTRTQKYADLSEEIEADERLNEEREPDRALRELSFDRFELPDSSLHIFASEMSAEEFQHWADVKFPALDQALEDGIRPSVILKLFKAKPGKEIEAKGKELSPEDARFASAYLRYQLNQPETRLRHFNERYRDYAQMLDRCQSRDEVIAVSSRIRIENAAARSARESDEQRSSVRQGPALSPREVQTLFTEQSPRHYTSEMISTKLNYAGDGAATRAKTEALRRGEIVASPEALKLVDSLESRMERRYLADSLSATKHFLQSLKTPNEDLRFKNSFDHSQVYQRLAPSERDFVYQLATMQKERLETNSRMSSDRAMLVNQESNPAKSELQTEKLRETMKTALLELSLANADSEKVKERTNSILFTHLRSIGIEVREKENARSLSKELSDVLSDRKLQEKFVRSVEQRGLRQSVEPDTKLFGRETSAAYVR